MNNSTALEVFRYGGAYYTHASLLWVGIHIVCVRLQEWYRFQKDVAQALCPMPLLNAFLQTNQKILIVVVNAIREKGCA